MRRSPRAVAALLVISGSLLCASLSPAQPPAGADPERDKLARQLVATTGADRIGMQVISAMLAQFKTRFPTVPETYWTDLQQSFKSQEMVELIIPIYTKNFSAAELKEILGFYQTPVGKKVVATLPAMTQDSMAAGMQWGQQKAAETIAKLKAAGYQPAGGAPPGQ